MKINQRIEELRSHIKEKEKELREIKEAAIRYSAPKGYPSGTSYEDYDCIHGSKKRIDIHKLAEEIEKLETLIEVDKKILEGLIKEKNIEEKIHDLETIDERVMYLRRIGYTVEEIAETVFLSPRQVYRHLRRVREREGE
jgi:DNA-binding transcriptional ArsR family regulator